MRSVRGRLGAGIIAIGVSAAPAHAMEIAAYDQLSIHDKARYVVLLLERTKEFLTTIAKILARVPARSLLFCGC